MYEYEKLLLEYKAMSTDELVAEFGLNAPITDSSPKVYFIGDGRLVYIGYTRRAPARVTELQNMSPVKLQTPEVRQGSLRLRNFLQATLAHFNYRDHGDWYAGNLILDALLEANDFCGAVQSLVERLTVTVELAAEDEA